MIAQISRHLQRWSLPSSALHLEIRNRPKPKERKWVVQDCQNPSHWDRWRILSSVWSHNKNQTIRSVNFFWFCNYWSTLFPKLKRPTDLLRWFDSWMLYKPDAHVIGILLRRLIRFHFPFSVHKLTVFFILVPCIRNFQCGSSFHCIFHIDLTDFYDPFCFSFSF